MRAVLRAQHARLAEHVHADFVAQRLVDLLQLVDRRRGSRRTAAPWRQSPRSPPCARPVRGGIARRRRAGSPARAARAASTLPCQKSSSRSRMPRIVSSSRRMKYGTRLSAPKSTPKSVSLRPVTMRPCIACAAYSMGISSDSASPNAWPANGCTVFTSPFWIVPTSSSGRSKSSAMAGVTSHSKSISAARYGSNGSLIAVRLLGRRALRHLEPELLDQHVDDDRLEALAAAKELLAERVDDGRLLPGLDQVEVERRVPRAHRQDRRGVRAAEEGRAIEERRVHAASKQLPAPPHPQIVGGSSGRTSDRAAAARRGERAR
jgi:hypothetical protein